MIAPEVANVLPEMCALCEQKEVERLSLFGSATTKYFLPETSDVDCLVKFSSDKKNLGTCYFDLIEGLEKTWQRHVDILVEGAMKNYFFRQIVDTSKILIYDATNTKTAG